MGGKREVTRMTAQTRVGNGRGDVERDEDQTDGRTDRQRVSGRLRANNYSLCLAASMTMYHNNPSPTHAHTHTHAGSSQGNESLFICTRDNPALLAPLRATEGGGGTGGRCGLIHEKDTILGNFCASSQQTFLFFWLLLLFFSSVNLSSGEPSQEHGLSNQTDLAQPRPRLVIDNKRNHTNEIFLLRLPWRIKRERKEWGSERGRRVRRGRGRRDNNLLAARWTL